MPHMLHHTSNGVSYPFAISSGTREYCPACSFPSRARVTRHIRRVLFGPRALGYPAVINRRVPGYPPKMTLNTHEYPGIFFLKVNGYPRLRQVLVG